MYSTRRVAVITGGERGLGLALSLILISEGFEVFSLDIVKGVVVKGKKFVKADISDEKQVARALKKISSIDLLVNNAGIMRRGETFSSPSKDFDSLFAINVKGSWLITKQALSKLNKNAVVVMISSRHSSLPSNPGLYGLSKKCVESLAKLLEKESFVKKNKIKIKVAAPGPFRTALSRTGYSKEEYAKRKLSSKEEVAEKVFELIVTNKKRLCFKNKYFFE